jgi:hypothetical protein
VDYFDELVRRLGVKRGRIPLGIDEMGANVVLDHLRHQAGNAAADARDHVHDALASGLFGQRPLDRFNLAANAAYRASSFFFSRIMSVMALAIGYPPILCQPPRQPLADISGIQKDDPPGGTTGRVGYDTGVDEAPVPDAGFT